MRLRFHGFFFELTEKTLSTCFLAVFAPRFNVLCVRLAIVAIEQKKLENAERTESKWKVGEC